MSGRREGRRRAVEGERVSSLVRGKRDSQSSRVESWVRRSCSSSNGRGFVEGIVGREGRRRGRRRTLACCRGSAPACSCARLQSVMSLIATLSSPAALQSVRITIVQQASTHATRRTSSRLKTPPCTTRTAQRSRTPPPAAFEHVQSRSEPTAQT